MFSEVDLRDLGPVPSFGRSLSNGVAVRGDVSLNLTPSDTKHTVGH